MMYSEEINSLVNKLAEKTPIIGFVIYKLYTLVVLLLLASMIKIAGPVYGLIWAITALLLYYVRSYEIRNTLTISVLIRALIVAGISVTCFISTFHTIPLVLFGHTFVLQKLWGPLESYAAFFVMASMMEGSVMKGDGASAFLHIKNAVILALLALAAYSLLGILYHPIAMVVVKNKMGLLWLETYRYASILVVIVGFNHLLGRSVESLAGFKEYSISDFMRYFVMGIVLFCLGDMCTSVIFTWIFPNQVLLNAYNVKTWEVISYYSYQSIAALYILMQTTVEEIMFRTVLYAILEKCNYGKEIREKSPSDCYAYYRSLVVLTAVMSFWFSALHLSNPIETGRAFGSLVSKCATYLESIGLVIAYLLTGNIALSLGIHFTNNFKGSLIRFSGDPMNNGFHQPSITLDTMTTSLEIKRSIAKMAVNTILVVGAKWYMSHLESLREGAGVKV